MERQATKMPRADATPLQSVHSRHRIIMRMQLKGFTTTDIAETLGMNISSLSYVMNSDIYKAELEKLQARADDRTVDEVVDVKRKLEQMSGFAVSKLDEMLRDPKTADKLRVDMIFDVLDRTGNSAPKKVEHLHDYTSALQKAFENRKKLRAAHNGSIQVDSVSSRPPSLDDSSAQVSLFVDNTITVEVENLPAVVGE